ncbi:acyltransferase [Xanthobacter sp. V4C-4]|uniref:acyltransferase family protein n=1 Tax=Xanthobacter cornucopiae TaxID=3119924 RepID=UPI00372C3873
MTSVPSPAPAAAPSAATRVTCLDGLRGVAACAVVVFHFFYAFTPGPFMDRARGGFGLFDTPVAVLWNGHFAVAVFFALSGFVLAASSPRTLREAPLLIGLRYFRLAVPALVSSVIAWAWLEGFPDAARGAQALTGSSWFRWTYQPPIPPLSQAIFEGGIGVFLNGTTRFNNPLWTMQTELLGSLLIYGAYAVFKGRWRTPALTVGLVGFALSGLFSFAAFCGGALIFEQRHRLRDLPVTGAMLGIAGLVLGATYPGHTDGPGLLAALQSQLGGEGFRQAGAVLLMLAVLTTPWLRGTLERPAMQRLGALSFPIYLVHVPLIVAPASWIFVAFHPLSPLALLGLFAGVAAATAVLAGAFLATVERPVLAVLKTLRVRGRARLLVGATRGS